ncbi:MAG: hypothetical protein JO192_02130 [Candidatus Eremiobacteraeota bacterium]|nr:hypothetical protein [Candidatus Eremiobacteraeota bacterium]
MLLSSAVFAACSGSAPPAFLPQAPQAMRTNSAASGWGKLTLRIRVPAKARRRPGRPNYISPATQALTLGLTGPTKLTATVSLLPGAPGCAGVPGGTQCTLTISLAPCPAAGACYDGAVATYDAVSCAGKNCSIPPGAHELSANQSVSFAIARGSANETGIALDGVPVSAAIVPDGSSQLSGNASTGFTLSKCAVPQHVSVLGVDADGNYILGAGAPAPSLVSDDPAHFAVAKPSPSAPNRFTLSRPAIPNANAIVHLTAGVKPAADSGAPGVQTAPIAVRFNGDVCGVMTEYAIPTAIAMPVAITTGPDGALWFTEGFKYRIGRITTDGTITEPVVLSAGAGPGGIITGPDGKLWFFESNTNAIANITTAGALNESTIPTPSADTQGIAIGSDGALWFTEEGGAKIGRILTGGLITGEFSVTGAPLGIAAGGDGALWFTTATPNAIGRITTSASVTTVATTAGIPSQIVSGPDGNLWFGEETSDMIGRLTLAGTLTEFKLPTQPANPVSIAVGPDGALWFTEFDQGKIGRITTDGTIDDHYKLPPFGVSRGITTGPDGALWFTDCENNAIGRLQ